MLSLSILESSTPILLAERFSDFAKLKHITAWVYRFISTCCHAAQRSNSTPYLTDAEELTMAENYWFFCSPEIGKIGKIGKGEMCQARVVCCQFVPSLIQMDYFVLVVEFF